jgi:hypothetical protein
MTTETVWFANRSYDPKTVDQLSEWFHDVRLPYPSFDVAVQGLETIKNTGQLLVDMSEPGVKTQSMYIDLSGLGLKIEGGIELSEFTTAFQKVLDIDAKSTDDPSIRRSNVNVIDDTFNGERTLSRIVALRLYDLLVAAAVHLKENGISTITVQRGNTESGNSHRANIYFVLIRIG